MAGWGAAAVGGFIGLCAWIGANVLGAVWPTLLILLPVDSIWVGLFVIFAFGSVARQMSGDGGF